MKRSPEQEYARRYMQLAHEQAELMARVAGVKAAPALQDAADMESTVSDGARRLIRIGNQAVAAIDDASDKRLDMAAPQRQFMLEEGIKRPARKHNTVKTTLILQACLAVEAAGTAALLVGDGTMGLVAGLLTGTVFSATNITLGVATGYFGLRGIAYRKDAPEPKPDDRLIRTISAAVTAGASAVMGCMHLAAARVRVVGDHTGIWDWETASLAATFGDYNAIALLVTGGLSSALAVREGWGHLADPIWGYSQIAKETEDRISNALDSAYDDGAERLETALVSTVDMLETLHEADTQACDDYRVEIQALREDVGRFNCDVKLAVSELKTLQTRENKRREYLEGTGRAAVPVSFDLAALRQLRVDETVIPDGDIAPCDPTKSIAHLEEAFEEASGKLRAAHTAASNFITLPFSEGRKDKEEKSS